MPSHIEVKKVTNKKMKKQFIMLPWTLKIYKNDPAWVPPIIHDQKKFLDPKHGYFFEIGEVEFFLAYIDGKPVGRITAQVNHLYEGKYDNDTGFFGFFECINSVDVAKALFNAAEEWLRERGKTKMNGPQNFSIYDGIGFEVHGEDIMPSIGLFHYANYYKDLAVACGLQKCIDWHCVLVQVKDYPSYFDDIRNEIWKNKDWDYVTLSKKKKDLEKRADDIKHIFNAAWEGNWGHLPLTDKQWDMLFKELSPIVIPEIAQFAEKDGKTIAFMLTIPDINSLLAKLKGHLYPWRVIRLLWGLKMKTHKQVRTIIMGVLPEHRGKHIDDVFYLTGIPWGFKHGIETSDCSLIVETNKRMLGAIKHLNGDIYKTYRLYEKPI